MGAGSSCVCAAYGICSVFSVDRSGRTGTLCLYGSYRASGSLQRSAVAVPQREEDGGIYIPMCVYVPGAGRDDGYRRGGRVYERHGGQKHLCR